MRTKVLKNKCWEANRDGVATPGSQRNNFMSTPGPSSQPEEGGEGVGTRPNSG